MEALINHLPMKDNILLKSLKEKLELTESKDLKKSLKTKIKSIEQNKIVLK